MHTRFTTLPAIAVFILCSCLIFQANAANKIEKSKEALSDVKERIETLKKELDSSEEKHAEAADELKKSERSISDANRKLFEINLRQKQNLSTLENLQLQKTNLESTIQQQQQLLGSQIYQQYLHGRHHFAQVILKQEDPGMIARDLHYFSYVSRARAGLIASMQANLDKVARLNDQTAETLKEIAQLKTEQEQERKQLQLQKSERKKILKKLSVQIGAQRGEINKLKRDEKRLSNLVERLSRMVPKPPGKKSRPIKPAPAEGVSREQEVIARNEALPSDAFDGGNFASLRGKLNLPVRGDITNRFGAAREDSGVSWKGLFIRAAEGSEVKSIASGRVVFADWLRGFGNLLIVDHGGGYMSLYGNNQALLKKVGDPVKGGDTVAAVGNSGGNETSGLYYELRRQSKPFDPLSWSVVK